MRSTSSRIITQTIVRKPLHRSLEHELRLPGGGGAEATECTAALYTCFTLINADTDQPVPGFDPLPRSAVLSLSALPTRNLNIRDNSASSPIGSVRFSLSGAGAATRTDSAAPYALFGDNAGDYSAWVPRAGNHNLTAQPYSGTGASGIAGTAYSISFTVKN